MSKIQPTLQPEGHFPDPQRVPGDRPLIIDVDLSVDTLLEAYQIGFYPKADERGYLLWECPDPRTVLFLDEFKVSRSLRQSVRNRDYVVTINHDFGSVIQGCAFRQPTRRYYYFSVAATHSQDQLNWLKILEKSGQLQLQIESEQLIVKFRSAADAFRILGPQPTWISNEIITAYKSLHQQGYAHSIETWQHGQIVGGLYGVCIGQIFFGESMFSTARDASKVALFHLVDHLKKAGFHIIDCQEPSPLLLSLCAREIPRLFYLDILHETAACQTPHTVWQPQSIGKTVRRGEKTSN